MKLTLFILFTFFESLQANGLGFLGCCGGPGPGPYPAGTMTPSGYPIYGMAPHASDAVAYSSPGSSYGYGSSSGGYGASSGYGSGYGSSGGYGSGYGSSGGGYGGGYGSGYGSSSGYGAPLSGGGNYGGSESGMGGGGGIDFDSIPYGSAPPGSQPIAIRYFKEAIPVDIDPARLRPLGPTQLIRMPVYGISRSHQTEYSPSPYHQTSSSYHQSTPNLYRPAMGGEGYTSKYNKFAHPVESDIARGYQPAYSNWNRQPMQAVFRQSEAQPSMGGSSGGSAGQSSSGFSSSGSENIAPVRPAPADASGFSEMSSGSSSSGGSDFGGSRSGGSSSSGLEISPSHGSEGSSRPFPGGTGGAEESSGSSSGGASKGPSSFPDVRSEVKSSTGLSKTGFPDLESGSSKSEQAFPDIASPGAGKTSGSISNSGNAFPDISKGGKAGSFQTAEASMPAHFRARAAAATSSATSAHASELKPVHLQNLPRKSTGAENYKLSGEVLEAVNEVLLEREKAAH